MEQKESKKAVTRRQFLKGISFGVVGAVAVVPVIRRLISRTSQQPRQQIVFSDDSIFAPAKDKYPKA